MIPKGHSEAVSHRGTENIFPKRKRSKRHTMIYKSIAQKANVCATQIPLNPGVNSRALEGKAVPAPLVAPIVLLLIEKKHDIMWTAV